MIGKKPNFDCFWLNCNLLLITYKLLLIYYYNLLIYYLVNAALKAKAKDLQDRAWGQAHRSKPERIGTKLNFDCFCLDIHLLVITHTGTLLVI